MPPNSARLPNPLDNVQSHIAGIAWPPLLTGWPASLAAMLRYFEESQWLPTAQIERAQYRQLVILAAYANTHSPLFRARLQQAGLTPQDLATPQGFARLSVLTRRDIQQMKLPFACAEVPPSHLPTDDAHTSGSTGEPLTIKKTTVTKLFWLASQTREYLWHKRDLMGTVLAIRGGINEPIRRADWGNPVNLLFRSGQAIGLPATMDIREHVRFILDVKPAHLNIYPSHIDAIVSLCERENIAIPGVEHIWSISETLRPETRRRAEAFFRCKVEDCYSSQEIGIMALQCPESGLYHVMSEHILMELLDDKGNPCREGESGRVVVTDLHNFATPMIRYAIGDHAVASGPCPCGRGLHTLKAILGRDRGLVVKPDGSRHWPPLMVAFYRAKTPILQFQVIQHSLDDVEIRLVTEKPATPEQENDIRTHMADALGHPFPMRFTYFEQAIPRSANGKFEEFICRIS